MKETLPATQAEAIKLYAPHDGWFDPAHSTKALKGRSFDDVVDKVGLSIGGSNGGLRKGPYREAVRPIGKFLKVVEKGNELFAAFEHYGTPRHKKREAASLNQGSLLFLLRANAVELLRTPDNAAISNNITRLKEAAEKLELARAGLEKIENLSQAFPYLPKPDDKKVYAPQWIQAALRR
jgi:hypothetical protein